MKIPVNKVTGLFFLTLKNSKSDNTKPTKVKLKAINKESLGKFTGSTELNGETNKVTQTEVIREQKPR